MKIKTDELTGRALYWAVNECEYRLIAAAPELLEALEGAMKWWMETSSANHGEDCMPADLFDNALAAINKAKGERS